MGYLLCGPVGTGKTFLVECLAGEAGVPVVKLKNFRDRWVGSSEGNLEKIFRLVRALGRCMVFIDEADQTLGRRESGSGDSGLSGRLYSMIAQEMADTANRGRVLWILASSRPDLIEVDLKRPGRVDVKVPLLPTSTPAESAALIGALAKRYGLAARPTRELATLTPQHADPADAGRRRSAGRQGVSPLAHRERRARRRARGVPHRLSESRAGRRARIPDAHRDPRSDRPRLRAARVSQVRCAARARHERQALLPRRRLQRAALRHAGAAELVRRRGVRAARRVRQSRLLADRRRARRAVPVDAVAQSALSRRSSTRRQGADGLGLALRSSLVALLDRTRATSRTTIEAAGGEIVRSAVAHRRDRIADRATCGRWRGCT